MLYMIHEGKIYDNIISYFIRRLVEDINTFVFILIPSYLYTKVLRKGLNTVQTILDRFRESKILPFITFE